jgi:hypothetical protein
LAASGISAVILGVVLSTAASIMKTNYTTAELNFLSVAWVALSIYFLSNLALYSAFPKYKQIVTNDTQGLARRAVFTACIAVGTVSLNVLAGLSTFNFSNFVVYTFVPVILGSVFLVEGLVITALRRVRFFLT